MADLSLGYVSGPRDLQRYKVDSAATFAAGEMVSIDSDGFVIKAVSGANVIGVAFEPQDSASGTDGETSVLVDISPLSVYRFTATSVTQAMLGKTCDVAGAQAIDVAASTDDCIKIVGVDVAGGLALCQIKHVPSGVV